MDVMKAISERCSVRSYKDKPVEEAKIRSVIEAARLAPSAYNRQEWRFIVVRDKEKRQRLMHAAKDREFVGQAPVIIACCAVTDNHVMTCGQLCYPIDVAIAIEHMALKAVEEGLGSCWIGSFYEDQAKEILGVPQDVRIVELMTLGYPAQPSPKDKNRLTLDQILMQEHWQPK